MLVRTRLSVMMFLFYASLGSWAVTLSTFLMSSPVRGGLNFTTREVGWIYSTFAFGGMAAPVLVGLLADRLFRAERVMAVSALVAAALLFAAGLWCDHRYPLVDGTYRALAAKELVAGVPVLEQRDRLDALAAVGGPDVTEPLREEVRLALDRVNDDPAMRRVAADTFWPLFLVMFAYCFFLQLALTLTTVISLRNLADPGHQFSRVRMFGTLGWVVAGNALAFFVDPVSPGMYYVSAAISLAHGAYSFTLPPTHPRHTGRTLAEAFGAPALRLFRKRSFAVFVGVAFIASVMNQFYGVYAHRYLTDLGVPRAERIMTIGQVVEVAVMFVIPLCHPKRWLKVLMVIGLTGWVVRGAAMTFGDTSTVLMFGVPMHGWSFAFFNVVAATYLDREAPNHLRASVQGIITFASGGLGVWIGNLLAGWIVEANRTGPAIEWAAVWTVPTVGCAAALVVFVVLFKTPDMTGPREP